MASINPTTVLISMNNIGHMTYKAELETIVPCLYAFKAINS
ncbi:hypothetical protein CPS_3445 [Colwellia psychrerythraea 34H]|uniref:Uncharacterized protein n=1 Tax=Colwellia psychrerythraea (strain 34H / ATCC BAA-681) TaxID=167879 RepID=Q47YK0_COLP3|nr:hypothetical protein CPS_3445 [Colwellia psychrerythraea 34H]